MKTAPLVVFSGGGTGGHLFPALAVIEWFRAHQPDVRFEFLCTEREIDARLLRKWEIPFTIQPVQPIRRKMTSLIRFYGSWRRSCALCRQKFRAEPPAVVVGTGGYGSAPAVRVAARMGLRTGLFNPDAIPGKANRYLARFVDLMWVQWQETRDHLPKDRVRVSGCPVRRAFLEPPSGNEHAVFGLSPQDRTLVITGASSGARSLNESMVLLAPQIAQVIGWQILHISGHEDLDGVRRAYENSAVPAVVVPFTDDMPAALQCADLVVARAGAVTLAELAATASPSILLPYPYHADQHQRANAEMLATRGAAVIVEDTGEGARNAPKLGEVLLTLMNQPQQLEIMRTQAQRHTPHDSAEVVSTQLAALAAESTGS